MFGVSAIKFVAEAHKKDVAEAHKKDGPPLYSFHLNTASHSANNKNSCDFYFSQEIANTSACNGTGCNSPNSICLFISRSTSKKYVQVQLQN